MLGPQESKRNFLQAEGVCPAIKSYRDKHKNAKKHHQSCKDVRRHYQSLVRTFAKALACPKRHPIERLQHRRDWPQQESPYISGKVWPSRHTKLTKNGPCLLESHKHDLVSWELPGITWIPAWRFLANWVLWSRPPRPRPLPFESEKSRIMATRILKMWYPDHGTYQTEGYDGGNDWCQQWPGEHVVICHSCRAQSLIGCMLGK